MAANRVEIQVKANTKQAEKGLKSVEGRMKGMKGAAGGLTSGFSNLSKMLGVVGLGTVGIGAAATGLVRNYQDLRRATLSAESTVGSFGDAAMAQFEAMEPDLRALGREWNFTEKNAKMAYATIARESKMGTATLEDVANAFALSRLHTDDLGQAATIVGQVLSGNISPLEKFVDTTGDLETLWGDIRRRGFELVGAISELGFAWEDFTDGLVDSERQSDYWTNFFPRIGAAVKLATSDMASDIGKLKQIDLKGWAEEMVGSFVSIKDAAEDAWNQAKNWASDFDFGGPFGFGGGGGTPKTVTQGKYGTAGVDTLDQQVKDAIEDAEEEAANEAIFKQASSASERSSRRPANEFERLTWATMQEHMGRLGAGQLQGAMTSTNPTVVNIRNVFNPHTVHEGLIQEDVKSNQSGMSLANQTHTDSSTAFSKKG